MGKQWAAAENLKGQPDVSQQSRWRYSTENFLWLSRHDRVEDYPIFGYAAAYGLREAALVFFASVVAWRISGTMLGLGFKEQQKQKQSNSNSNNNNDSPARLYAYTREGKHTRSGGLPL